MSQKTILVADDDRAIRTVLRQTLSEAGYIVRVASSAASVMRWVEQGEGDLLLTDVIMPDHNMFEMLPRVARQRPGLPIVVISAQSTLDTAMKATSSGAYEYLPKPFDLNDVLRVVEAAFTSAKGRDASPEAANSAGEGVMPSPVPMPEPEAASGLALVGRSQAMQAIFRTLARASTSDLTVLVTGESGTGKEVVARALHSNSARKGNPFITIDLAAIPREHIEAELFGIERGTYAGGVDRTEGCFGRAETGTLFLDEVGEIPMEAQIRLLRVIQDGQYTAVGGRAPRRADVRIVAATQHDLTQLIQEGRFREDLYYRLNVVPVQLPPLRERPEDIPDLTAHFLKQAESEGLPSKTISKDGLEALIANSWPGNVRELENFLRRLCVMQSEPELSRGIISGALLERQRPPGGRNADDLSMLTGSETEHLAAAVGYHVKRYFARHGEDLPPPGLYERVLQEVERPLIEITLARTKGNQLKAAHLLGLNRNTLRKKIKDLGIDIVKGVGA